MKPTTFFPQHKNYLLKREPQVFGSFDACQYAQDPQRCVKSIQLLGRGSFSSVYSATNICQMPPQLKQGEPFLVKRVIKTEKLRNIHPGFSISLKLHHPNIIQTCSIYHDTTNNAIVVVQYLAPGMELFSFLEQIQNQRITDLPAIALILYQYADALAYMHANGIVHGDIKPENTMYDPITGHLTIIDMDSIMDKNHQSMDYWVGTLPFAAPDIIKGQVSPAIDMWALGMILYEMWSGTSPVNSWRDISNFLKVPPLHYFHPDTPMPTPLKAILQQLLEIDPKKRMTAEQLLHNPWIQRYIGARPSYDIQPYYKARKPRKTVRRRLTR